MKDQTTSKLDTLYDYAVHNLQLGNQPSDLIKQLTGNGVDPVYAVEIVRRAEKQLLGERVAEPARANRQVRSPWRAIGLLLGRISPRLRVLILVAATVSVYWLATVASLPPSFRPPSGIIGTAEHLIGNGRLVITNNDGNDSVILLSSGAVTLSSAYVRASETFTMSGIPKGEYILYYSQGWDWNGHTFNHDMKRRKYPKPLPYKDNTKWKLTINVREEDGTQPHWVDEKEFPALPPGGPSQP